MTRLYGCHAFIYSAVFLSFFYFFTSHLDSSPNFSGFFKSNQVIILYVDAIVGDELSYTEIM